VSDQIAQVLRTRIFRRELRPGTRLIEFDVCSELGVSRAPLREALLLLEREGLVEIRPHRGAIVVQVSEEDLPEITELRTLLEVMAARKAAERGDGASIKEMRLALDRLTDAAANGDSVEAALAHVEFHRAVGRASGYRRLSAFVDQLTAQSLALRAYAELPQGLLRELAAMHEPLLAAIEAGDSDAAGKIMDDHVNAPTDVHREIYRLATEAGDFTAAPQVKT
jgi:DNA-binding GntR family transcriptional regulator